MIAFIVIFILIFRQILPFYTNSVYISTYQDGLDIIKVGDEMYRRIRELREDNDLLQRELAEYLHCSQVAYSRYELGTREIPTEMLIRLAKYYNISIDYILGLTDEKKKLYN